MRWSRATRIFFHRPPWLRGKAIGAGGATSHLDGRRKCRCAVGGDAMAGPPKTLRDLVLADLNYAQDLMRKTDGEIQSSVPDFFS